MKQTELTQDGDNNTWGLIFWLDTKNEKKAKIAAKKLLAKFKNIDAKPKRRKAKK